MNKEKNNLTTAGLWSTTSERDACHVELKERNGCSSYPAVPKTRCPPAKPPRRKLSYPCDKIISDSSKLTFKGPENEAHLSGPVSLPASINQMSKQNHSKENSISPLDGSDYGSLQGDIWPPKSESVDPNWQRYARPSVSQFCSTPSTVGYYPHPNYFTPVTNSTTSTYFTPPCTPWNVQSSNLPFDLNTKKLNLPFKVGKITPTHRRHHSDPQISLERKPSLARRPLIFGNSGASSSRRSHSFASSHGQAWSQLASVISEQRLLNSEPLVLVEEVRMLREICNKLWDELQQTQSRLEVLQNHSQGAAGKPQFSELLSEVYYAQKERDQAVQQRLELAFKERDQALKETEHMKELLARCNIRSDMWNNESEDGCSDFNYLGVEQMLNSLESCWSPSRLHQQREKLLHSVRRANEARQQDFLNQLQEILEQKDHAVAKVKLLSQELERCCCKGSTSWECNGFPKEERSKALQRMEELEDELESLRLCYSLQSPLEGSSGGLSVCGQLTVSPEHLNRKLEEERRARIEAQKECTRLERWVSVLIKKLNGLSVGVAV